jgi:poly(beta-D-mannuronate) lyase
MKKTLIPILILAAGLTPSQAREIPVANPASLQPALASAAPGDVIILAKGNWTNTEIKVDRGGSEGNPVEIRAERPGETLLTGASFLQINAPHVVVDGLYFTQGCIDPEKFSVIHFKSSHGTVRNCAIVDFNPAAFEDEYYWVYFEGNNNLLEKCYFKGKNNHHPLLGNAIVGSHTNTVRDNYFKNIPYADGNGREILRLWGPGKFDPNDKDGAYSVVEGNLFDGADGEGTEIISLKSNYNRVLSNTILSSRGCLNIRQGAHNVVQGNILMGKGVAGAQGLRMSGLNNTVTDNFVSGCDWGIRIQTGEYTASALTSGYEANMKEKKSKKGQAGGEVNVAKYPQVKDLLLANNVSANNTGADLEVGFAYKKRWPESQLVLLPENCQIRDNRFVRPHGGESVIGTVADTAPPLDVIKLAPNTYENNILVGGSCAYPPADSGFKTEPLPPGWTETSELGNRKPLTPEDVGPAWVIALRKAGQFAIEDDKSCYREDTGSAGDKSEKKKKKKKKDL